MIEINLLPEELRQKQARFHFNLPVENLRKIIPLVSAGLVLIHLLIPFISFINSLRLKQLEGVLLDIQPQKEKIDEIAGQLQKLRSLDELFQGLGRQRLNLAARLNIISDYLPQGVWLSELSLAKDIWEIKGSYIFMVDSEMSQIGRFLDAIKSGPDSSKDFASLELVSLQRRKLGPTELVDFIFGSKPQDQVAGQRKK